MQTPALRLLALIGLSSIALMLGACHGDSDSSTPAASAKAACGGATEASATMHCPPGFTQPKS
jgi:hypothetical protein